jgi:hypothetical protein
MKSVCRNPKRLAAGGKCALAIAQQDQDDGNAADKVELRIIAALTRMRDAWAHLR